MAHSIDYESYSIGYDKGYADGHADGFTTGWRDCMEGYEAQVQELRAEILTLEARINVVARERGNQ